MICEDKDELTVPTECLRCGTCCRQGGPALHGDDLHLVKENVLPITQLVTIRHGEPAYDPLQNKVMPSGSEFIKIKGQGNSWSCLFFDQVNNGCLIYRTRPLECCLLFCRDTGPLTKIMGRDLLNRQKLLSEKDPVLPLLDQQETECSYQQVNELLANADNGRDDVKKQLLDLVRKDLLIRDGFLRNYPNRRDEELFLFGRPLFLVLVPYGFRLVEKDGSIDLEQTNSED